MKLDRETIGKIKHLILFTVVIIILGINYQKLWGLFGDTAKMLSPFMLGAAIAFILNVPMRKIESFIGVKGNRKWMRPVSLSLTILLILGILGLVMFVVVPELIKTIWVIQTNIPVFINDTKDKAEQLFIQYPQIVEYINRIEIDWKSTVENVIGFLTNGAGTVLSNTVSAAVSFASGMINFGIGLIFAVYILLQKEQLGRQVKGVIKAYLPEAAYRKVLEVSALSEKTFSNFLAGQCLEAVILGSMFFLVLAVMRMPYALLIGVLIAFTALIPIFGAFIGATVGAFLMLMTNPLSALTFLAVFFILQQLEGNLIYPHVVGNSVGLPSIWVLVAVTLGGSAFGVIGMLVFIPLCSVIYTLLRQEVNHRLSKQRQKKM